MKTITNVANLPNSKQPWTRPMFHWYDHLTSTFVPSLGLGDVAWHMEALNKYTVKTLNDSPNSIALLDTEVTQTHKAVLQNRMAFGVLTVAKGVPVPLSKWNVVYIFQIVTKM